jgi:hypothetical protein
VSTLRVNAIQNTTGGDLVTAKGMARAWVNFNGTGTVAIRTSFNLSSITDVSTGRYTVNFATAMPDADYCAVATAGSVTTSGAYMDARISGSPSATGVTVSSHIQNSGNPTYYDVDLFNVIIME